MTRPMPGPPECYDIDWHPIWGVVWVDLLDEDDQIVNHSDLDKKRMTDSECAAEYWRAEANFLLYLHGYEYEGDPVPDDHNFVKWLETCIRFDTRPHALEEA